MSYLCPDLPIPSPFLIQPTVIADSLSKNDMWGGGKNYELLTAQKK